MIVTGLLVFSGHLWCEENIWIMSIWIYIHVVLMLYNVPNMYFQLNLMLWHIYHLLCLSTHTYSTDGDFCFIRLTAVNMMWWIQKWNENCRKYAQKLDGMVSRDAWCETMAEITFYWNIKSCIWFACPVQPGSLDGRSYQLIPKWVMTWASPTSPGRNSLAISFLNGGL